MSLHKMNRVLDYNAETGVVRVQAGITIAELERQLAARGRALAIKGAINVQSLAGAMATATHGSSAHQV